MLGNTMKEIVNNIEIRVVGQMRNGNHAIIDWIRGLYPNRSVCFLNNIRHGNSDPFKAFAQIETYNIDKQSDIEALRNTKKDILIYSYEDNDTLEAAGIDIIRSVFDKAFEKNREYYLGKSKHHFDILIIRDPFNSFASRLTLLRKRGGDGAGGLTNLQTIKENWKAIAKKVVQIEEKGDGGMMVINYNKWISDETYSKSLSRRLMGSYWKKSLDDIAPYGGGSSFDHSNIKKLRVRDLFLKWYKLLSMRRLLHAKSNFKRFFIRPKTPHEFLTRWRAMAYDKEFRGLFEDRDIFELSEAIFGEIPDTRGMLMPPCIE